MLFRFKSKACADLVMLEPDGRRILQAMIGSDPNSGIVRVADLPTAIKRLQEAVEQEESMRKSSQAQERSDKIAPDPQDQPEQEALPAIGLAQRAVPMLTMLQRCMDEQADLVWGV